MWRICRSEPRLCLVHSGQVLLKQRLKEAAGKLPARLAVHQLLGTEAVDLVPGETECPVFLHHLRVALRGSSAVVAGVVLAAVDLDHDPLALWEQQQEVHALAN
jgi:hypothetical protein